MAGSNRSDERVALPELVVERELREKLQRLAEIGYRSLSAEMRKALAEHVERHADLLAA